MKVLLATSMYGAPSDGAKHTRARSGLFRLSIVVLSAAVLALGTVAVRPLLAAGAAPAVPVAVQQKIATTAEGQVGQGPCPNDSTDPGYQFGSLGYQLKVGATSPWDSCVHGRATSSGWCAIFAGWVWSQAGVDLAGLSYTPSHFYSYGKTWGTKSSTPAIGDAVLFTNYDPTKPKPTDTKQAYGIAHVAIVVATSADKTHFASVGGNEQNQVERDPKTASEPEYASAPGTPWGKLFVYEFIAPVLKPVAPTSVKATISKMSPLTVSLTWAESSYPDSFTIKRTNNTTGIGTQWPEPASTRSYSDTSVVFGDTYTYTVCAVTVVEPSACSSTSITVLPSQLVVTLTPSSQWVVAGNAAAWTVSWSGGSGSYSLSFSNGDNFSTSWTATAAGSTSFSKVMSAYPCSGDSATSTQTFIVTDSKYTPHKVTVTSTTRVNPGKLC